MIFSPKGTPKSWHQWLWHETKWWRICIWNCRNHRMLPICLWIFCFDLSNGYNFILFVGRRVCHDWYFIFLKNIDSYFFYSIPEKNLFYVLSIDFAFWKKKLLVNKFLLPKYITSKPKYFEKISICNRILCLEFFKWQKVTENSVHSVDVMYQGLRPGFKT